MIENGSNNKTSIVKNEPESSSECHNSHATHSDMLTLHKEMGLSPLNYDYDNVDIESINIGYYVILFFNFIILIR